MHHSPKRTCYRESVASRTSSNSREGNTHVIRISPSPPPISLYIRPLFRDPVCWSENTSNEIKVEAADLGVPLRKYLKRVLSTGDNRRRFTRWDNGEETHGNTLFIDSVGGIVKRNMSTKILANTGAGHARIEQADSGRTLFALEIRFLPSFIKSAASPYSLITEILALLFNIILITLLPYYIEPESYRGFQTELNNCSLRENLNIGCLFIWNSRI